MPKLSHSKRGKRPDPRPARKRYWTSGRLVLRKLRNLVIYGRMAPSRAIDYWDKARRRYRGTTPSNLLETLKKWYNKRCLRNTPRTREKDDSSGS